ncbi:unnamed protein product [Pleuronectes platessa]|uniref:Uncharacterized protein n=1 Tax=Pleuronectes platessa TaxID=8262 RepID=A0A9N7UYM7_PLEPL|nr:unnamed protein product [Pleuronectes platessa]
MVREEVSSPGAPTSGALISAAAVGRVNSCTVDHARQRRCDCVGEREICDAQRELPSLQEYYSCCGDLHLFDVQPQLLQPHVTASGDYPRSFLLFLAFIFSSISHPPPGVSSPPWLSEHYPSSPVHSSAS